MQAIMKDKVALIVGADDAVGKAIAGRLAEQGARLALAARWSNGLDVLVADLTAKGKPAIAVAADPRTAAAAVDQVRARFGTVDVLIVNPPAPAGLWLPGLFPHEFDTAMHAGVAAPYAFLKAVMPLMQRQGSGRVINLSSLDYLGLPGKLDKAAALSGLFGLTRAAALEAAPHQVTVNMVVMGELADAALSEEENARRAGAVPVKRLATPDDIAYAVSFFASDAAKYVTGQTFFVCGGTSVYFSMSV
jgi:3-oxoacyl-[acyl-carrier protein] reductase/2-[hydroxy(phenyl)methyl]-succinyl-CoA dehydrogenase BbsC subunit